MKDRQNLNLGAAIQYQQADRLPEAIEICKDILNKAPNNFECARLLAILYIQQGTIDLGVEMFAKATRLNPDDQDTRYNLAVALNLTGNDEQSLDHYRHILSTNPTHISALNNYASALLKLGRHQEAIEQYDRLIALSPHNPVFHYNRGVALQFSKRLDEALSSYDRAISFKTNYADAYRSRGILCSQLKRYDEAFAAYDKLVALSPDQAESWISRARIRCQRGELDAGIKDYQQALKLGGDKDTIRYELAQFGVDQAPNATPKNVVASMFDSYADYFDEHLVNKLKYQTPSALFQLITSVNFPKPLDALDLGCGTGMMGKHLRQIARTLHGVDLSPKMLEKAKQRKIYDDLTCSDIVEFLSRHSRKYDVITASDVFVYLGDLTEIFKLVRQTLQDNGLFCFSTEVSEGQDFVLRSTGRYAQSSDYLLRLANSHRFVTEAIKSNPIREQSGESVMGYIALMRGI